MECMKVMMGAALLVIGLTMAPLLWAAGEESSPDEVQERGVTKVPLFKSPLNRKMTPAPNGDPPPHLCHSVTHMLTQCKCFTPTECQPLTALFPNSCPPGSQHCEFVPMSRGPMPSLPSNLCGYQVPLTVTECSCKTAAECQALSPFCPGACPPGSQSCTCRPLRRG